MKRIMTAALALSLLGGTSALAQDNDRREARQERRAEKQEKREERREQKAEKREARKERAAPAVAAHRTIREQRERVRDNRERVQERRQDVRERRDQLQERRQDLREARQAGADVREQRLKLQQQQDRLQQQRERVRDQRDRVQQRAERNNEWYRNYRPGSGYRLRDRDRDRTWWDSTRWRHTYHATNRYRASRYVYPSGWYMRVWSFGDVLPHRSWYSQSYYLDWWRYDLPRPPIGTEWIRMRDDAVLVDIWNGRVLAVYHDLFW